MRKRIELLMGILTILCACFLGRAGAYCLAESKKPVVVIDVGHGGVDAGKISASGDLEKDINLEISFLLKSLLEQADVRVILTRETDCSLSDDDYSKNGDLRNRNILINEIQPSCAVSIHQNSFSDTSVLGPQVFYHEMSSDALALAELLQESLNTCLCPEKARKAKSNDNYYLLKKTTVPTVIAECGFLSNPDEAAKLTNPDYQRKVAWAIHLGILNFISSSV